MTNKFVQYGSNAAKNQTENHISRSEVQQQQVKPKKKLNNLVLKQVVSEFRTDMLSKETTKFQSF